MFKKSSSAVHRSIQSVLPWRSKTYFYSLFLSLFYLVVVLYLAIRTYFPYSYLFSTASIVSSSFDDCKHRCTGRSRQGTTRLSSIDTEEWQAYKRAYLYIGIYGKYLRHIFRFEMSSWPSFQNLKNLSKQTLPFSPLYLLCEINQQTNQPFSVGQSKQKKQEEVLNTPPKKHMMIMFFFSLLLILESSSFLLSSLEQPTAKTTCNFCLSKQLRARRGERIERRTNESFPYLLTASLHTRRTSQKQLR